MCQAQTQPKMKRLYGDMYKKCTALSVSEATLKNKIQAVDTVYMLVRAKVDFCWLPLLNQRAGIFCVIFINIYTWAYHQQYIVAS